ncbi:MAG TPA: DUF4157 domain-containing protein, partial [Polyangiaceae bacterium]
MAKAKKVPPCRTRPSAKFEGGGSLPWSDSQPATRLPIQSKLEVSEPGDLLEQEADRAAAQVMSSREPAVAARVALSGSSPVPAPREQRQSELLLREPEEPTDQDEEVIQRACDHCTHGAADDDDKTIQRSGVGLAPHDVRVGTNWLQRFRIAQSHGGEPLPPVVRQFMEARFGTSFERVKVHHDETADALSRGVHARAFTQGTDIFFRRGEYQVNTQRGSTLLAHELAHTIQQRRWPSEHSAAETAPAHRNRGFAVQRQPDDVQNSTSEPALAPSDAETSATDEPTLTRAEEIDLSRRSPGAFTGDSEPLALSLYNFGI